MKTKKIVIISLVVLIILPVLYISLSMITGSMKLFVVLSESMVPVMLIGDAIIVEHTNPEDINVGDIIAFYQGDKKIVSHRVVEIYGSGDDITFQTKGDNVKSKDPFIVKSGDMIGKAIFKIPYIGYLTKFSKKPILFLIFTIIPSIIIIFDEVRKMTKSSIQIKRMEREQKRMKKKEDRAIDKINYGRVIIIVSILTIILFALNIPYVNPEFWINFSNSPYLMSGISYIIIQAIILFISSSLWLQNRNNKNSVKEFKKEIKRGLYNISNIRII